MKIAAPHRPVPPDGVTLPGGSVVVRPVEFARPDRHTVRRLDRLPGHERPAQVPRPARVVLPCR